MKIVSYSNDPHRVDDLVTLINDVYRDYPVYRSERAASVANALGAENPFFQYGAYRGFMAYADGKPVAHACAITDSRLGSTVGLTGFFESLPERSYAHAVIREAIGYLGASNVKTVRGPVDLTTWNGFRVSYPEDECPFGLEPFTRGYYRDFFHDMGFSVAQRNVSTASAADEVGFDRFNVNKEQVEAAGFRIEQADPDRLPAALSAIHTLVSDCFSDTWSFVPVSFEEFQYSLRGSEHSRHQPVIHVAYSESGAPVGFCLGVIDSEGRAVVKSVAVIPMRRRLQIARALLHCFYVAATNRGAYEFILSTMRDDNKQVRALVSGERRTYRQYEVYELSLGGEHQ